MPTLYKLHVPGLGTCMFDSHAEADAELASLTDEGDTAGSSIVAVEMTEAEAAALPEFDGW